MSYKAKFPTVKSFLLIFLPILLLFSSIATTYFFIELKSQKLILMSKEQQNVETLRRIANDDVKSVVLDLFYLSIHPVLHQMIENNNPATRKKVANIFYDFSDKSKLYDQIRFLDETGMERIRINFRQKRSHTVANDELQNKAKRYYFADTFKLDPGRVFVSPFDLNIEHGQIEDPLKPMIRFGTTVVDLKGRRRGIVLLNYLGATLIHKLIQSVSDSMGSFMLLNAKGYWLKGLKPEDEWGFMYKDRQTRTLVQRHPKSWERISAGEEGQFSNDQGIYTFATIWPLGRDMLSSTGSAEVFNNSDSILSGKDFYWKIVSLVTNETLQEQRTKILFDLLPFYGFIFLLLAFVSLGLSLAVAFRKQISKERLRSEKFQGVLEMAGSICHEINQPMQAVSGYSELLLMDLSEDNPRYSSIKKIKDQTDRMGKITKKLMKITKYETKSYLDGKILDIDKSV